jgi:hypothetical protein
MFSSVPADTSSNRFEVTQLNGFEEAVGETPADSGFNWKADDSFPALERLGFKSAP